jgi:thiol-disulfide isomerase/thioredoxin/DNA-binding beta-propeller fold protein YncE
MIGKKAPDFSNFEWINSKPLSMKDLNGYIVILDFWTYCCINCMHMLHTLSAIEEKYKDKPVVVIGIHSAKFYNEQVKENIEKAIERYEINHPVVVDEDMKIWQRYGINAWPTIVIIDPKGNIVYKQSGEGQQEYIEDVIDILLERYKPNKKPLRFGKVRKRQGLAFPSKISLSNNRLAISDSNNNRILIVSLDGEIEEVIGGKKGFKDGDFKDAQFYRPQGVLWIKDKIYVADTENHALRVIDLSSNEVKTLAGTGEEAWHFLNKDPKETSLNSPWDLAYYDNRLYIAMAGLHQIWRYDLLLNRLEVFAGNGYEGLLDGNLHEAEFAQPSGLSINDDKLYVADSETSSIRMIDLNNKYVKTIIGKDLFIFGYKDGNLSEGLLQHPIGLDANGDKIYVADTYNHAIRVLDLEKRVINTLIARDNSICTDRCELLLYEPNDVKYHNNRLYIADTNNHLIRIYDLNKRKLDVLDIDFSSRIRA